MLQPGEERKRKTRATSSTSSVDSSIDLSSPESNSSKMPDPKKSKNEQSKGQTTLQGAFSSTKAGESSQSQTTKPTSIEARLELICTKMVTEESLSKHIKSLITMDELSIALDTLKTDLMKEVNTVVNTKLQEVQGEIHELSVENRNLKETVKNLTQKLDKQSFATQTALNRAKTTEIKVNELEQYGRKSSVRIFGLNDTKRDETISETAEHVKHLLSTKLDMDVNTSDIDIAHRLGRFEEGRPRPVIVKFMTRKHKIETIQKRRALKGSRIVIREDLTPLNQSLLKEVSNLESVDSAWTKDGQVYAKDLRNGNIVRVTHYTDLSKF